MKIPYNILIQIKMSVRPYFKGFTLIFFFYNCRKQDYSLGTPPLSIRKCRYCMEFDKKTCLSFIFDKQVSFVSVLFDLSSLRFEISGLFSAAGELFFHVCQRDALFCHQHEQVIEQIADLTGVRQLKIHKSSKSGLVAAFFVSSP